MTILNAFKNIIVQNVATNGVKLSATNYVLKKSIWGYVAIAFNSVDTDRLQKVGPDRLCAEWVMKNGGAIGTVEHPNHLFKDYNSLPSEDVRFNVKLVDATGSSIMKIGFEHFKGCKFIDTLILHQCKHLEEDGLEGIIHLKKTLKMLQVSACDNISDKGLMVIGELLNLKLLKLFQMRYVKDMDNVRRYLETKLPKCNIEINKEANVELNG